MSISLDSARYISLETFRKDGSGVKTPVWAASLNGKIIVGTDGTTFKVKRLRNNPQVRLAACNASGKKILGPWFEGSARIVDKSEAGPGDAALNAKYGWQRRSFEFLGKLFGRLKDRVIIEITIQPDTGTSPDKK